MIALLIFVTSKNVYFEVSKLKNICQYLVLYKKKTKLFRKENEQQCFICLRVGDLYSSVSKIEKYFFVNCSIELEIGFNN